MSYWRGRLIAKSSTYHIPYSVPGISELACTILRHLVYVFVEHQHGEITQCSLAEVMDSNCGGIASKECKKAFNELKNEGYIIISGDILIPAYRFLKEFFPTTQLA